MLMLLLMMPSPPKKKARYETSYNILLKLIHIPNLTVDKQIGNDAWTRGLEWSGKNAFKNAANTTWITAAGATAGSYRSAKGNYRNDVMQIAKI